MWWPVAVGPPGPGRHYFFTNNALAGILILVLNFQSRLIDEMEDNSGPNGQQQTVVVPMNQ